MVQQSLLRVRNLFLVLWLPDNTAPLGQRFASSAFWSLLSSIISRGMGLVANIIVARMMGVAEFGELGLIRNTVLTLGVLTGYGLGLTTTKYVAEYQFRDPRRTGSVISVTTVTTIIFSSFAVVILWLSAHWTVSYMNLKVGDTRDLYLSGVLLIASAVWSVLQSALVGFQAFQKLTVNNTIYGTVTLVLSITLTFAFGITGSVIALSISAIVGAVLAGVDVVHLCKDRSVPLKIHYQRSDFSVLWEFSIPAYLSGIIVMPVMWWAFTMMSNRSYNASEVGLFNAADQWRTLILFLPQALGAVVLPFLSEAVGENNEKKYSNLLWVSAGVNVGIAVIFAGIISFLAKSIINAYGSEFADAYLILIILSTAAIPQSFASVLGQAFASRSKMWWGVFLNSVWAILVISTLYSIFEPTAIGLAKSLLLAYFVQALLSVIVILSTKKLFRLV